MLRETPLCMDEKETEMKKVIKKDRQGNVIAEYLSITDAANENYVNRHVMARYCNGEVKRPSDGYVYEWGD